MMSNIKKLYKQFFGYKLNESVKDPAKAEERVKD
jgi:hypothetical protein